MPLPTFFIPHGAGPCFFMDWSRGPADTWDKTAAWLRRLVSDLPERPKAILMVSGHWEEAQFTVGSSANPPLIFDYYGFPPETYQLRFEAAGSPRLARRVRDLLDAVGLPTAEDTTRGYDHGVFVPLLLATPEADIPVIQLSLRHDLDPEAHLVAGRALRPLRDEGVLIVGSGMSWHNMRGFSPAFTTKSEAFDAWLSAALADPKRRDESLRNWESGAFAREAHPREEHLAPLFIAAGAAEGEPGRHVFKDIAMDVAISGYAFG